MVSETWFKKKKKAYPNEISWTFCSTCYRAANGSPINL